MSKVRITFKSPDAVYHALRDIPDSEKEHAEEVVSKYVEYYEYVTIEIDLDTEEATVVPR